MATLIVSKKKSCIIKPCEAQNINLSFKFTEQHVFKKWGKKLIALFALFWFYQFNLENRRKNSNICTFNGI